MPEPPQAPQSICILRLSALGDVTHVLPVVRSLQRHWPETPICWIIGKLERRLLEGVQDVEFIVFDKRGGWPAVRQLRQQLAGRHFEVLLHMQVAARANLLSRLVSADRRIGWDRPRSRDFHHWFTKEHVASIPQQHQVDGFLEFARILGLPAEAPEWNLPVSNEARAWAANHLGNSRRALLISPCSSHPQRNWRAEYYARVADHASARHGFHVLLTGGPSDLEVRTAEKICRLMRQPVVNLVGQDTLEQSKALLAGADLLISPDSGPAHIASALGTPVLGLYAATWSRRSGPYRSLDLCVDRFPEAARRYRKREPTEIRWGSRIEVDGVMDLVTPEDVILRLDEWAASPAVAQQEARHRPPPA